MRLNDSLAYDSAIWRRKVWEYFSSGRLSSESSGYRLGLERPP
jgi:hypothetical protein